MWEGATDGEWLGKLVGSGVGSELGTREGMAVGLGVAAHLVALDATNPSLHSQMHVLTTLTGRVEYISQPCEPSSHG